MDPENHQAAAREEVFAALDELNAMGIKPTATLIRERFEKISFSLILEFLRQWNSQNLENEEDIFPPAPESVSRGLARLWAQARLLSDEETERERLDLSYQRQLIEKEKQEMLLEIQRLETEHRPQIKLRESFDLERTKLETQLNFLHEDLKKARLSNVDTTLDKQHLEREALGVVLQQGQMKIEIQNSQQTIDQLKKEKEEIEHQLHSEDLKKYTELSKTEDSLYQAQDQINSLQLELEQEKENKSAIAIGKVDDLENKINILEGELEQNKSKLHDSEENESEQRLKKTTLEKELILEQQERNKLEDNYSQIKSQLDELQNKAEEIDPEDIKKLENKIKELSNKTIQYKNVFEDKKNRFDDINQRYETLKKENEVLRSANELEVKLRKQEKIKKEKLKQGVLKKAELKQEKLKEKKAVPSKPAKKAAAKPKAAPTSTEESYIDDFSFNNVDVPELDLDAPLDKESEAKLKEGEEILELAKRFAIEDQKKAREEI